MKEGWTRYIVTSLLVVLIAGCSWRPTKEGQQYKDGRLDGSLVWAENPNISGKPVNTQDIINQIMAIEQVSPVLYQANSDTFQAVIQWLIAGANPRQLRQFGLNAYQMGGKDHYGNVQFTGYYTPVIQARRTRQSAFQYPFYRMPSVAKNRRLPSRASIYAGALANRHLEIAYSNSIMDNFIMEVQGSGYLDFGDGQPLTFLGYGGKNGWAYRSIGKILIDRGVVAKEMMSLQAIRQWADHHTIGEVQALLEQNPSFVFFKPQNTAPVTGASGVPLIAKAAVASDRAVIPAGSTLLLEVPLLNNKGKFTGYYEMRLMVALDVGGAIKGQHFDIYHGIGSEAGYEAGFYNHYGRVWLLKTPQSGAPLFNAYHFFLTSSDQKRDLLDRQ